jgi:hypothetical protein
MTTLPDGDGFRPCGGGDRGRIMPANTTRAVRMRDLEELRAEHRRLLSSMAYAFAMGHGCTVGRHPMFDQVLERERSLRAQIAEHRP